MAESVLSAFLTVTFKKLASEALKIVRSKEIDSKLKKLNRSLYQIQDLLNDASQKEITSQAVKRWLNDLQHLAYDIDDVLDELATEVMRRELTEESGTSTSMVRKLIPNWSTNFSLSSMMHHKLDNIITKLQELVEAKNNLGLSVITSEKPKTQRYEASLVDPSGIVGREGDKKALLRKLLGGKDESCNQNFSIVPIVGMGGVGKTTLARLLYDEKEVKDHFELKAWVCVSDEFSIFNISKVIYQSVTGEIPKFEDLNLLQEALKGKLQNKLFLIVLDDVWSESYSDWEKLVGPFLAASPGSRIIMTTRKEQLLKKLGFAHQDLLQVLSHDDAMSLFSQHALGVDNFDSHPTLRPYGEDFVKKCDGLPLALIALGRLLRSKTDEEEWKKQLESEIWRLKDEDEIIPALRLSYYDLPASLKLLFAYCSLFPKDYVFDKMELILLWMAEGFLHVSTTSKSMECLGLECFEDLLSKSFFQHAPGDKSVFVMHDLMNDLAASIAGDFFTRLDIGMKKEFSKDSLEKYRHMSFVCERYMLYKRFEPFKEAKSLRTFLATSVGVKDWTDNFLSNKVMDDVLHNFPMLRGLSLRGLEINLRTFLATFVGAKDWTDFFLSNKVLDDLLHNFPMLRVLSLSRLEINEVPESIGDLKHLRYLNLSRTHITRLPNSVCNLYNLQTLLVSGCYGLEKLPNRFSKLKNLQHFDMSNTPYLKKMPFGIVELKGLRTLSKIIIGGKNGFSIMQLKDLKDLQGKFHLKGLDKVQSPMHAQEANLSQKRLSELEMEWDDVFGDSREEALENEVLNVLKPHNDLKKLSIVSFAGIQFPNWVGDPLFLRLAYVRISSCKKCTSLPLLGHLPSLKELLIEGMDEVKVVGLEFLGSTGLAFPSLETLSFLDMKGWEVWSTKNSGVVKTSFPCLQELFLYDCPNLVDVSVEAIPSLRSLQISLCGHEVLKSLVHVASLITTLKINYISGLNDKVWGGVTEYLGAVEEISICACKEIRYLWESEAEASKAFMNLRTLNVYYCSNLVSLGEKEDNCVSSLASVRQLSIRDCKSLEHCTCPNSLESLTIIDCISIKSLSFPTGGGQNLKSLDINSCEKLVEKELVGGQEKTKGLISSSMLMLESVFIEDWPNLKSISELICFNYLSDLVIRNCPNMDSFPDHELPKLSVLTSLTIAKCESMDASFSHGLWPPKLCSLRIGRLKKPISKWGKQNFPSTLVELVLVGGPSEDVSNLSQLSHLLPSSLTSLGLDGFEKLKSVSVGLQHLKSLQHLYISKCPKTRDLPEMLLPSLLKLSIFECPKLKRRVIKGGSYWSLVSRIPETRIHY